MRFYHNLNNITPSAPRQWTYRQDEWGMSQTALLWLAAPFTESLTGMLQGVKWLIKPHTQPCRVSPCPLSAPGNHPLVYGKPTAPQAVELTAYHTAGCFASRGVGRADTGGVRHQTLPSSAAPPTSTQHRGVVKALYDIPQQHLL